MARWASYPMDRALAAGADREQTTFEFVVNLQTAGLAASPAPTTRSREAASRFSHGGPEKRRLDARLLVLPLWARNAESKIKESPCWAGTRRAGVGSF